MHRYYALHKPYEMLSQFIGGDEGLKMLSDLPFDFPPGIHAVGRLDYQSEGLLLLTTDSRVTRLLFSSSVPHKRCYLVQVYKEVNAETLERLRTGVSIRIKEGAYYTTTPCQVSIVERPQNLAYSEHELRANIPQTWMLITLTEGKYRQVRKMLAAVKHRCQRLVRVSIENLELGDLPSGSIREMESTEFFRLLLIDDPDAG